MKKTLTVIMLFLSGILFASDINEYMIEAIKIIEKGKNDGEIGWNEILVNALGGSLGPQSFAISRNNKIYIGDQFNGRLNVYDINFNLIKAIPVKYGVTAAEKLIIDDNENSIAFTDQKELVKVDNKGNLVFQIKYRDLPDDMKGKKEYFILDEDVLYYEKGGKAVMLDNKGQKKTNEDVLKIIETYNENSLTTIKKNTYLDSTDSKEKIKRFLTDKKLMIKNEMLLTADFKKFREYSEIVKSLSKNRIMDKFTDIINKVRENSLELLGYDSDGNNYWEGSTEKKYNKGNPKQKAILVCSKYGEVLDYFYNIIKDSIVAVASNGDVYFREPLPRDGKFHFYKITRRW